MKKILPVALAAVVVVGAVMLAVLAVEHYKNYQNKNTQKGPTVEEQLRSDVSKSQAETKLYKDAYEQVRLECEKGRAAYDSLTVFAKRTQSQPVCGTAVLQQ